MLHFAAERGNIGIIQLLLNFNDDLKVKNIMEGGRVLSTALWFCFLRMLLKQVAVHVTAELQSTGVLWIGKTILSPW